MRTTMNVPAAAAAVLLTALVLPPAAAQTSEAEDTETAAEAARSALAVHQTTVSGAEHPDAIPFIARMQAFFQRFHMDGDLSGELALTAEDREILSAFAEELFAEQRRLQQDMCSQLEGLDVETMDAVRRVSEIEALTKAREDELTRSYTTILDSLSPQATDSVERYVDTRIAASMSWTSVDFVGLAEEAPEVAARLLLGRCEQRSPPTIASASYSRTADPTAPHGIVNASIVAEAGTAPDQRDTSLPRATIRLERLMSTDELIALLAGTGLELEAVHHRNVGAGHGTIRFSPEVDVADALRAAEERVVVEKLARAYASQLGVGIVMAPSGPLGTRHPVGAAEPGRASLLDRENAPRPTREELEAIALPPCPAGDELAEPVPGTDPLTEAACGFLPYALVVRGEAADIEALRESAGGALEIELRPEARNRAE